MKKTHNLFYKNPTLLLEILELRKQGLSFNFLAELYNCDRTTIRHQCRKYQIFPTKTVFIRNDKSPEIFNPQRIIHNIIIEIAPQKESNWVIIDGERVNTGKSYADYLAVSPYNNKKKNVTI